MTTRTPEEIAGETIAELQAIEGVAWDEDTIARATVVAVWAVRSAVAAETERATAAQNERCAKIADKNYSIADDIIDADPDHPARE